MAMERLGAHIRERRHQLELTQEEVAAQAGLPLVAVSQLEHGNRLCSIALLDQVLDVLGEELLIGKLTKGQFDPI